MKIRKLEYIPQIITFFLRFFAGSPQFIIDIYAKKELLLETE